MKPIYLLLLTFLFCIKVTFAQQQSYNGTGQVVFSAGVPLSLIKGTSTALSGNIDMESGKLYFEIPIKSFQFANSLMQERFNDKYMESSRYTKAVFTGKLHNYSGRKDVTAHGTLTIHGVSKKRTIKGTLVRQGDKLLLQSVFVVSTKHHHIDSPKLTNAYMAEDIDVKLDMLLYPIHPDHQTVTLNQKRRTK